MAYLIAATVMTLSVFKGQCCKAWALRRVVRTVLCVSLGMPSNFARIRPSCPVWP